MEREVNWSEGGGEDGRDSAYETDGDKIKRKTKERLECMSQCGMEAVEGGLGERGMEKGGGGRDRTREAGAPDQSKRSSASPRTCPPPCWSVPLPSPP